MDVKIIVFLCCLVILLLLLLIFLRKNGENYSYNYTKLTKDQVLEILKKDCNLTLKDYINVLNSTENLKNVSLQHICNNLICSELSINNSKDLMSFIHTIVGKCVLKCIENKDWYRLAFINLKVNMLLELLEQTKLVYKRALTNGVYSAEYINMYYEAEQLNVTDLMNMYIENFKDIKLNEDMAITSYIKGMLNNISNIDNQDNKSFNLNPVEFAMISTMSLVNIYESPLLDC